VQGRGALRAYLMTTRAQRRPHGRIPDTGLLVEMVLIANRPDEMADRTPPGHWERDWALGKRGQSAIIMLVERQSRFVMLRRLPHGRLAVHGKARGIPPIPRCRSLTLDRD
jgi:IS30 family transposase